MPKYLRIHEITIKSSGNRLTVNKTEVKAKRNDVIVWKASVPFTLHFNGENGSPEKGPRASRRQGKKYSSDDADEVRFQVGAPVSDDPARKVSSRHQYEIITFDGSLDPFIVIEPD